MELPFKSSFCQDCIFVSHIFNKLMKNNKNECCVNSKIDSENSAFMGRKAQKAKFCFLYLTVSHHMV